MSTALAVLTAAGSGTRLGCDGPKALVELAGTTLLERSARGLAQAGVAGIVVTAPADQVDAFATYFPDGRITLTSGQGESCSVPVLVVAGSSASRQASVALGLDALETLAETHGMCLDASTPVLVHDAARALTPPDAIRRVIAAVTSGYNAVIPVLPVTDTLKQVGDSTASAHLGIGLRPVVATPDRSTLVSVQTPQGFAWSTLREAHESARTRAANERTAATDDAGLVEDTGGQVMTVPGDLLSMKVTTRLDLALATLLLDQS